MTGVASTVVTKPLIACLRLALGLMSLLGLTACGTDVQTTTETSTPAPQTTAPATTASATPGPKSRVLRVRIEDQEESPEFSITMPDYVAPGRYTLVVDDRSSCAFHLWGPDVDVISRDGVSRFEIRLQKNQSYTAACNWGDIGKHPAHTEGLDTDNLPWSHRLDVLSD